MSILENKQNYKESTNKSPLIIESRAWRACVVWYKSRKLRDYSQKHTRLNLKDTQNTVHRYKDHLGVYLLLSWIDLPLQILN